MTAPPDALPISDAEVHAALRVLHEDYDPVAYHTEDEIRRAIAAALAVRAQATELPPLPKPKLRAGPAENRDWFDAEQMRQYARDALAVRAVPADEQREALRRLWPLIERGTKGFVFTAAKAGEVAADKNMLREWIAAPPAPEREGDEK